MSTMQTINDARYVSLESFKRNGDGVKTPVWVAEVDGNTVFLTDGESYKVKRIRRNANVRVAPCNGSGSKILGPWQDGTARIVEDAGHGERIQAALSKKYGWQFQAFRLGSFVSRRAKRRMFLEVTLTPAE
jgi:uncharacterized protein